MSSFTPEQAFVSCMLHSTPGIITYALKQITAGDLMEPAATICRAAWHVANEQLAYTTTEPIDITAVQEKLDTDGNLKDQAVQKLMETAISSTRPPAAMWEHHLTAIHVQRFRQDAESLAAAVVRFKDDPLDDLQTAVNRFMEAMPVLMARLPSNRAPTPIAGHAA